MQKHTPSGYLSLPLICVLHTADCTAACNAAASGFREVYFSVIFTDMSYMSAYTEDASPATVYNVVLERTASCIFCCRNFVVIFFAVTFENASNAVNNWVTLEASIIE